MWLPIDVRGTFALRIGICLTKSFVFSQCSKQWYEILTSLMVHEVPDIQHRGVHIIMNMVEADKEVAQRIVESNMFEVNYMNQMGIEKVLYMCTYKICTLK